MSFVETYKRRLAELADAPGDALDKAAIRWALAQVNEHESMIDELIAAIDHFRGQVTS